MNIIEVNNLSKIFGHNPKNALKLVEEGYSKSEILEKTGNTVGVSRASFNVKPGETFVIMGLSGSGKSTLIRLVNRLIEPTEGSIVIDGQDLSNADKKTLREIRRDKLGMVFQSFALFPHRTILDNAEFGLEIQGVAKEERSKKAKDALELVGLGGFFDQYPDELFGGMQQRGGLARALANDPDILLMDEQFSALDPLIRREMQLEMLEIQDGLQKTIIIITHDENEAFKLGGRVAVMKDGRIVQVGTPEEIIEMPANDYIAEFIKDIDRSKVFQAEHVMIKPNALVSLKDGLNVAIKEMEENGISSVFVVDRSRR